nr:MAG TPA: hypothetical protein [Caudoviricetes sp.]
MTVGRPLLGESAQASVYRVALFSSISQIITN